MIQMRLYKEVNFHMIYPTSAMKEQLVSYFFKDMDKH